MTDDRTIVCRVVACRSVWRMELLACKRGGWKRFRVLDGPRELVGYLWNTREWFPHTTPLGAIMGEIRTRARAMARGPQSLRAPMLYEIELLTQLAEKTR